MKDFYDIWLLSSQDDIDPESLKDAIRLTFDRRGTKFPNKVEAFQKDFIQEKQTQWNAFRKRLRQENIPESFAEIVNTIDNFLSPLIG